MSIYGMFSEENEVATVSLCAVCGLGFLFGCFGFVLLGLFIFLLLLCGTYFCVSAYVL